MEVKITFFNSDLIDHTRGAYVEVPELPGKVFSSNSIYLLMDRISKYLEKSADKQLISFDQI